MLPNKGFTMSRVSYMYVICFALLIGCHANPSKLAPTVGGEAVDQEYLIVLKVGVNADRVDRIAEIASQNSGALRQKYIIGKHTILRVHGTMDTIEKLSLHDDVRVIEPNRMAHLEKPVEEWDHKGKGSKTQSKSKAGVEMQTCQEDFVGQDAWGIIRTSYRVKPDYNSDSFRWGTGDDGTGVDIYIVDTGIKLDHEDFGGRAEWGMTASFTHIQEPEETDLQGHGTHVAGIAGGNSYGIARNARLVAVKVLGVDGSPWSDTIEGLEWVVSEVQRKKNQGQTTRSVINVSLGGWAPEYALETAVQATIDAGVTVVTSAGNSANDTCTHTPQRMASIFTVVATDIDDNIAYYSNYGPCSDIMAPGNAILGPGISNTTEYVFKSGTSMACPHVVGTIARYLSVLPDSEAAAATPELIKAKVIDSATSGAIDLDTLEYKSTPDKLLYKVCEDARVDPPPTQATTPITTTSTVSTTTPTTTNPPPTHASTQTPKYSTDDIYSLTAASLGLVVVVLFGSFGSLGVLYASIKNQA